jgi:hypothetical protein
LRKIFRPNSLEVTRELRKFSDQELHNSSISAKNVQMIKSRGMITVGHLSFMGEKILWGNLRKEIT